MSRRVQALGMYYIADVLILMHSGDDSRRKSPQYGVFDAEDFGSIAGNSDRGA